MLLDTNALANQVQQTPVNITLSGDTIIVAAVTGKVITLVKLLLLFSGATNFTFKSDSTSLSGPIPFTTGQSMVLDLDPWYSTAPGKPLIFNSSQAVTIAGTAWFVVATGTS